MQLYADYIKELYGTEIIYNDNGFITYRIYEDGSLYLHAIHVTKSARGIGVGADLENQLIIKYKPSIVTCYVDLTTKDPELSLKVLLARGFTIDVADNTRIVLLKHMTYENHGNINHDKENVNNIYLPELPNEC